MLNWLLMLRKPLTEMGNSLTLSIALIIVNFAAQGDEAIVLPGLGCETPDAGSVKKVVALFQ